MTLRSKSACQASSPTFSRGRPTRCRRCSEECRPRRTAGRWPPPRPRTRRPGTRRPTGAGVAPVAFRMSSAARSSTSLRRAHKVTRAPDRARRSTAARPSPSLPPVMIATLPLSPRSRVSMARRNSRRGRLPPPASAPYFLSCLARQSRHNRNVSRSRLRRAQPPGASIPAHGQELAMRTRRAISVLVVLALMVSGAAVVLARTPPSAPGQPTEDDARPHQPHQRRRLLLAPWRRGVDAGQGQHATRSGRFPLHRRQRQRRGADRTARLRPCRRGNPDRPRQPGSRLRAIQGDGGASVGRPRRTRARPRTGAHRGARHTACGVHHRATGLLQRGRDRGLHHVSGPARQRHDDAGGRCRQHGRGGPAGGGHRHRRGAGDRGPDARPHRMGQLERPAHRPVRRHIERALRRAGSLRHAETLDRHGSWRTVDSYGSIWVPRTVASGWTPYSTGRWIWDPSYGWTWLDDAPWGWAPYHYGRWVNASGVWGWAPGPIVTRPVYAPALVVFLGGGVSLSIGQPLAWAPLGYGEPVIPWWGHRDRVGRASWDGWGGPRVVNNTVINNTTIINAQTINVYRNVNAPGGRGVNAVVGVPADRFGRGDARPTRFSQADVQQLTPVRGQLAVKPVAASLAPSTGTAVKPPDTIRDRSVVATRAPATSPRRCRPRGSPPPCRDADRGAAARARAQARDGCSDRHHHARGASEPGRKSRRPEGPNVRPPEDKARATEEKARGPEDKARGPAEKALGAEDKPRGTDDKKARAAVPPEPRSPARARPRTPNGVTSFSSLRRRRRTTPRYHAGRRLALKRSRMARPRAENPTRSPIPADQGSRRAERPRRTRARPRHRALGTSGATAGALVSFGRVWRPVAPRRSGD